MQPATFKAIFPVPCAGVPSRLRRAVTSAAAAACLLAACGGSPRGGSDTGPGGASGNADAATRAGIEAVARGAMKTHELRALVIRITEDGQDVYTGAMGESLPGVPATPAMHFRNGAFALTYIGQVFARLADAGLLSLDDKLATWLPQLPRAERITVRNLLNMTSGYADYVYQPAVLDALDIDPFRQWRDDELVAIGVSAPMQFEPGTNWAYSHTNYVILGKVLETVTGKPLADVMQEHIIVPMKLTATGSNAGTPAIPEPVLHTFSSERRGYLQVPAGEPFYEESTYWNPSWTTAGGAVQTTNIHDLTASMEIVGSGAQVSRQMYAQQAMPQLAGFGSRDPSGLCQACRPLTSAFSYGLGVILSGPWIMQTKDFAGSSATSGYLPSRKLTISVATTYRPAAFGENGEYTNGSSAVFNGLANLLAPGQLPGAAAGN